MRRLTRFTVIVLALGALFAGLAPAAGASHPDQRGGLACVGVTHAQLVRAFEIGNEPLPAGLPKSRSWAAELVRMLHDPAIHAAIGTAVAKGGPAVACVGSPAPRPDAAAYRLLRATSRTDVTEVFRTTDLSRHWYLDTGVKPGGRYYYRADILDGASNVIASSGVVAVRVPSA